jgi:PAS domain S-box-containing protein
MPTAREAGQTVVEDGLRTEVEWYRLVAESSQDVIFVISRDDTVQYVNPAAAAVLGAEPAAIIGKPRSTLFPPETAERQGKALAEIFRTGRPMTRENTHVIQGRTVWLDAHLIPLKDRKGEVLAVLGVSRDITRYKTVEAELRESESRFRAIAAAAQDAIVMMNQEGKVRFWNASAERMFGYPGDEIVGKDVHQVLAPSHYVERYRQALSVWRETGQGPVVGQTLELEALRKDGALIIIELSLTSIEVAGRWNAIAIIRDISARKRIERALLESERNYRLLVEQIPAVSYTAIADETSTTLYVSPQIESLIGYSPTEYKANPKLWFERLHPDDRERVMKELSGSRESRMPWSSEYRLLAKDGHTVWFRDTARVVRDEKGQPKFVQGVMLDITDRKRIEEAVRQSEEKYRELVENLQEGVWVIDQDAITTYVNDPLTEMLGYTAEEMLGRSMFSFLDERWKEIMNQKLEIRSQGIREQHDAEFIRKDGSRLYVAVQAGPILNRDGKYVGSIAGIIDITARKRAEGEALQLQQRFEEFVNNLPLGVYRNTPGSEGRFLEINSAMVRMFEAESREELMSRRVSDLYADPAQRKVFSEKMMRYGAVKGEEIQLVTLKGRPFPASLTAVKKLDANGEVCFDGVVEDITERKQAETALLESRSTLNSILDAVPTPIFCRDTDGIYTACNAAFVKFLGISQMRIIGSGVYDLAPKNLADIYHWADQHLLKHSEDQAYETRVMHADGTPHDVMFFKSPLRDTQGILRGLVGVILDITERKRIEEALRQSEERYRDLVENVSDVLYAIDGKGVFTYVSPIIEVVGGYHAREMTGHSFMEFIHPKDERQASESFQKTLSGQDLTLEIRGRHKTGRDMWLRVSMRPHWENSSVVGIRGIISDITPQKEAAEHIRKLNDELREQAILLERKRMEAELLAVSERERIRIGQELHDGLTQNLAGLAFLSKGLQQKLTARAGTEAAEAAQITTLLDEALTEARHLARGLYPVEIEANGLMSALQELAGTIRKRHRITCVFRCRQMVLIRDNAASIQLYRIAQEAVRNVIRHARATRITIDLNRTEQQVILTVRDNGKGISKQSRNGKGMGLRIMASRAQVIGADLGINCGRGGGTIVTCRWAIPAVAGTVKDK